MSWPVGRLPSIPEYYKEAINRNVDLINEPKQCCPFHKEDTPSFSYMPERKVWSCFGACHVRGANVIKMHQMNYKLNTIEEAENSLRSLCRCPKGEVTRLTNVRIVVDEEEVEQKELIQQATILANDVDRWLELDYVMSKFPVSTNELRILVKRWMEC